MWSPRSVSPNPNYPPDYFLSGKFRFPTPHDEEEAYDLGGVYVPQYYDPNESSSLLNNEEPTWMARFIKLPKGNDSPSDWSRFLKAVQAAVSEHKKPKIYPAIGTSCNKCINNSLRLEGNGSIIRGNPDD
jgi:hypothetical protein